MPLCLQSVSPVEPQPVNGSPRMARNETMCWSNARLFLNWSARLKITSGAKLCTFCCSRSRSSKMARCSVVWPSSARAAGTFASVFQSSVLNSALRSWFSVVGAMASNSARTLSLRFTNYLLGAFKFAGKQIIDHQRGDVGGHLQILLRVIHLNIQV